jgi:hypothetical protein
VPDGYRPRSYPVHGRAPRFLGPGTAVPSGGAAPPASPVWAERSAGELTGPMWKRSPRLTEPINAENPITEVS